MIKSREDMRRLFPEFDSMTALEKISLEIESHTRFGRYILKYTTIGALIGLAASIPGTYLLEYHHVISEKPFLLNYISGSAIGACSGGGIGFSLSDLVYEIRNEEGDIRQFFKKYSSVFANNFAKLTNHFTR